MLARSGNLAGDPGGGAVFMEAGSNATFANCLAVNNTHFAPGKARPQSVEKCVCERSSADMRLRVQGGAFKLVSGSSPRLVNVTIARNDAFFAGGIYTEARLLRTLFARMLLIAAHLLRADARLCGCRPARRCSSTCPS
jgi:hypothetical protein